MIKCMRIIFFIITFMSVNSFSSVIRLINNMSYYLHDDFNTADGECVLRGKQYATGFFSTTTQSFFIAKLNADGTVFELINNSNTNLPVIDYIECE